MRTPGRPRDYGGLLNRRSSCYGIATGVEEQEPVPTDIRFQLAIGASPRQMSLAPAIGYGIGDSLTNGVVPHSPLELINWIIVLLVEFSFHCLGDFGWINWAPDAARHILDDFKTIMNQHFCGPL